MAKKKSSKKTVKKAPAKKAMKRPAKKTVNGAAKKTTSKKSPKKAAANKPAKPVSKQTILAPYLNFNGNCEEAFNFYRSVFGGNFTYVGRFKEMPSDDGKPLPAELADKIMHISLPVSPQSVLMGSDTAEGFGPPHQVGNNFAISISAPGKAEADRLYKGLAQGGSAFMPMNQTFWGSYFGMLTDKFQVNWMVSFDEKPI